MKNYDYIILGAGAAGLMMAYRMANDAFFDNKSILILDKERKTQNDRTWCYWENGVGEWDTILHTLWKEIIFESELYSTKENLKPYQYKMIRSSSFYDKIWNFIAAKKNFHFTPVTVKSIEQKEDFANIVTNKENFQTKYLLNSIVFEKSYLKQTKYPVLNQHFVGWFIEVEEAIFDDSVATFMDFKIPQKGNTRFMYILPISKKVALFEYTLFSEELLAYETYEKAIQNYLKEKGITKYKIIEKEDGIIPMTSFKFWKSNSKNIIHIGTAGGWSKASTGFTFKNTTKNTQKLVAFLKTEKPLSKFHKKNKFWFYDLLFLDVLANENHLGANLFARLFQKNKTQQILKFLDNETTFLEDLKIMATMPSFKFMKVLFKRVF
ncbi:lycopene cyclase family protein [uncultured Polaribacter sp.]|uniref:lycopene cyclase family protein n=1 Tax=uncultured Polaribacter sp. TaxID=174711 RepID=UPI0026109698|nr:lycopene cyclase family protein [uncultured Polaribacter sp.]